MKEDTKKFYTCPGHHTLPHRTAEGKCTPVYCAAAGDTRGELNPRKGERKSSKLHKKAQAAFAKAKPDEEIKGLVAGSDAETTEVAQESAALARSEQMVRMGHAAGRFAARSTFVGLPPGLEGPAAEEWADKRLVNLLPVAVAEVEYQLKLGDDKQRMEAANRVLDANGRGKRDGGGGASGPIIILTGGSVVKPPWSSKASQQVIEVKNEGT